MPNSLGFSLVVEWTLITLTTLLLAQPDFLFRTTRRGFQTWAFRTGWAMLVVLFCWSIFLGRILSDYEIVVHF